MAVARTPSPKRMWPRSHHRPSVIIGTTITASSCGPVTVMSCTWNGPTPKLLIDHCEVIGLGYAVWSEPVR